ncbi:MAG: putative metal-binding motif-containing protein [Myxococcota bacterium]
MTRTAWRTALGAALAVGCQAAPEAVVLPAPPADTSVGDTARDTGDPDSDGDGWPDSVDCAPDDPLRHPNNDELCDGLDDNCDGIPELDVDGDGYLDCLECDDFDPDSYPGAPDPIDGVDQNCDGTDGVGTALSDAAYLGASYRGILGYALAAADLDGDGCDDLLMGAPQDVQVPSESYVAKRAGCSDGTLVIRQDADYVGLSIAMREGFVLYSQWGGAGRALLFDDTFAPGVDPLLDLEADGTNRTDVVTLLGSPPSWILATGGPWLSPMHLNLISTEHRGTVSLYEHQPDVRIWTDSWFPYVGKVGDVGDRDGDGNVDVALALIDPAVNSVSFFPEVYAAHVDDAPERWLGEVGTLPGFGLAGDADLDGDGLVDALSFSPEAPGEEPRAGRVFVTPASDPVSTSLVTHAPPDHRGEFERDLSGMAMTAADLDGDDIADLVVGAPSDWALHRQPVLVFGPLAGTYTVDDADRSAREHFGDHAGTSVALGDFDGSGQRDIAVGALFAQGDAEICQGPPTS